MRGKHLSSRRWIVASALGVALAAIFPVVGFADGQPVVGGGVEASDVPAAATLTGVARTINARTAQRLQSPARPAGFAIDRPTIPFSQYRAEKAQAGARPAGAKATPASALSSISVGFSYNADAQGGPGGGWVPPDVNATVGATQVAEVTNADFTVYTKGPSPTLLLNESLATLMNYNTQPLFDPRIEYDTIYNRWIVAAEGFPETSGAQYQFLAVSTTSNAAGSYFVYALGIPNGALGGNFWDYPQHSLTQDAVIFTGNEFNGNSYAGAFTFGIAKALLYNGLGFSVPIFGPFPGTTTPPDVIDQSPRAHLLTFSSYTSAVHNVFKYPNTGYYAIIAASGALPLNGRTAPPSAGQPGACVGPPNCLLDTLDGRFQNDTFQYGDVLWGVHDVVAFGSFPTVEWYQWRTEGGAANTVLQTNLALYSGCSDDFNPSIAAQQDGHAYLTWSVTEPVGCSLLKPSVVVTGRIAADAASTMATPALVSTSPFILTGNYDPNHGTQRWGDTSSMRFDGASANGWFANEYVPTSSCCWGTRIGRMTAS